MTPAKFASRQHAVQRRIYAGRSQDEAEARALREVAEIARLVERDILQASLGISMRRPTLLRNR